MPRLPSAEDLGFAPSMDYQRGLASIDMSPLAKGAEAKAAGLQKLGDGIFQAGKGIEARQEKDKTKADVLEEAKARSDYLVGKVDLDEARSNETDSAVLAAYRERYQANLDKAAGAFSDPQKAELFKLGRTPEVEQGHVGAQTRKFTLEQDQSMAALGDRLSQLQQSGAKAKTDADRQAIVEAAQNEIAARESAGYITAQQAAEQKRRWASGYALTTLEQQDPVQKLALARGGWEGALINRESSGNPRIVNQFGYAGLYQMGAPLLTTLGLYKPGADENLQAWSTSGKDAPGKWSGSFNIPGYPGVRTLADFRENPEAQRAAFLQSTGYYDGQIAQKGLDRYIGQTVGGVPITREGIYSMMHLGGVGGAEGALKRGSNAADANGSTVLSYAKMAANAGPGAGDPNERSLAKYLTPEQRMVLANSATRELVSQDRAAQQAQSNEAATVKSMLRDDEASIMASGAPLSDLTPQRVEASLGPAAAEQFQQNRQQAVRYHDATNDWDQIPIEAIRQRLGGLQPAAGAPGFDSANQYFTQAQKQAETIAKERQQDPAASVSRVPEVKAALDGASLDRPETYQPIAKARAIAMDRLMIPEDARQPMTRAEAQEVARPLILSSQAESPREFKQALKETIEQLTTAFGRDPDSNMGGQAALEQVLREAHLGHRTAEQAATMFRKLAGNTPITPQDGRAVDDAAKTDAADRAVAGIVPPASMPALAVVQPSPPLPLNFDPTMGATGTDYVDPSPTAPSQPAYPTPDPGAIAMLRGKPELSAKFDKTYGPGASERVMGIVGHR